VETIDAADDQTITMLSACSAEQLAIGIPEEVV
jgi:hypothetical protein